MRRVPQVRSSRPSSSVHVVFIHPPPVSPDLRCLSLHSASSSATLVLTVIHVDSLRQDNSLPVMSGAHLTRAPFALRIHSPAPSSAGVVLLYVRTVYRPRPLPRWSERTDFVIGSLATGQGTRCVISLLFCPRARPSLMHEYSPSFVLAATEHLHRRIAKMSERIHQLEDALAIMQAKGSNEPHPLLSDGSSKGKSMDDDDDLLLPDQSVASSGDVVTAFGMLSMSDRGVSRFFGPTGGTEVCPPSMFEPKSLS